MTESDAIPFYVPWITQEDKAAVLDALTSRWLTGGPTTTLFERQFANYLGVKHAVSVNSCTAALHLAMRVLNIKPGDEVIVPVLTFAATANAPLFCGGTPVFADIDDRTFNISPNEIQRQITSHTKALIVVHYGGQPCDMKAIQEIADDYQIPIVEDCAHSLGAQYAGVHTGTWGILGCFSFYPTKIITTIEGGVITTNDDELARKLRILKEHGMTKTAPERESTATWYYDVAELGYNYRMNDVQAALGLSQLHRIEEGIRRRRTAAQYYGQHLDCDGIVPPYEASNRTHIYHLYVIKVRDDRLGITRDDLFRALLKKGVGTSVHYTPLHLLSFYKRYLSKKSETFPVAEEIYRQILSLPLFPTLTRKQIDRITQLIQQFLRHRP